MPRPPGVVTGPPLPGELLADLLALVGEISSVLDPEELFPAIAHGVDFLLGTDPAAALYPSGYSDKPSSNWWKFGFPVFYVTDLLHNVEALVNLGYGQDPRLAQALTIIREKQDAQGCWPLEYDYTGKTWCDFGAKRQPNKWVTLRALRVLKAAAQTAEVAEKRHVAAA